jgi:hypothetical protein
MIDTIHSPAAIADPCGNKVTLLRDFLRIAWPAGIITEKDTSPNATAWAGWAFSWRVF